MRYENMNKHEYEQQIKSLKEQIEEQRTWNNNNIANLLAAELEKLEFEA
jgi:hypothetical protein